MKLYIFWNPFAKTNNLTLFSENQSMFQFLTHVEFSRSMVAILEMPRHNNAMFLCLAALVYTL